MKEKGKNEGTINVVPVIEVSLKSFLPSIGTEEGKFALFLLELSQKEDLLETPDGWFFPLEYLTKDINSIAKYLLAESLAIGELDVCGGLQIFLDGKRIPSVSSGSSFRYAMDLANSIITNEEDNEIYVPIDSHHTLLFSFVKDMVTISVYGEEYSYIPVPIRDLKKQLQIAQQDLREFAKTLKHAFEKQDTTIINSESLKYIFGL